MVILSQVILVKLQILIIKPAFCSYLYLPKILITTMKDTHKRNYKGNLKFYYS